MRTTIASLLAVVLATPSATMAVAQSRSPSATSVFSESEDASSVFHTIYFRDKNGRIVRIINAWNGGCCQRPSADEFHRSGTTFQYHKSYQLKRKTREVPAAIICHRAERIAETKRGKSKPDPFTLKSIAENFAEAKPFKGCKR